VSTPSEVQRVRRLLAEARRLEENRRAQLECEVRRWYADPDASEEWKRELLAAYDFLKE
jgi:hypothetical protein